VSGSATGRDGSRKRVSIACAWVRVEVAEGGRCRAFLSGRCERGSREVGIEAAVGSDMMVGVDLMWWLELEV
jgi:hypothetical protein